MKPSTCYMCDAPATSREHVPPKCIFPDAAEFRKNLITVPSCDEHNLRKSMDDELLRQIIACAPGNNDLCLSVVEGGVIPALERRPHIVDTFLPNLRRVQLGDYESASYKIPFPRFKSCIGAIVRGLFYADTGEKLLLELDVGWGPLFPPDFTKPPFFEPIRRAEQALPPMRRGTNPKVFIYDFDYSPGHTTGFCRLRFYEGYPIWVVW